MTNPLKWRVGSIMFGLAALACSCTNAESKTAANLYGFVELSKTGASASALFARYKEPWEGTSLQASQEAQATVEAIRPSRRDCADCPEMRAVSLIDGRTLLVAQHELTWLEYLPSVREASCPLPAGKTNIPPDRLPVTHISPLEFECFLDWLSQRSGHSYRLPSSEEWSLFAAPAEGTAFPWGDQWEWGRAAVWEKFDTALLVAKKFSSSDQRFDLPIYAALPPVESFPPDRKGLFDTVGSVAEYTSTTLPPTSTCLKVADAASCSIVVYRGGGVFDELSGEGFLVFQEKTFANAQQPIGFRVVRDLE